MAKIDLPDNLVAGMIPGMTGRRPEKKRDSAKVSGSFKSILRGVGETNGTPSIRSEERRVGEDC